MSTRYFGRFLLKSLYVIDRREVLYIIAETECITTVVLAVLRLSKAKAYP